MVVIAEEQTLRFRSLFAAFRRGIEYSRAFVTCYLLLESKGGETMADYSGKIGHAGSQSVKAPSGAKTPHGKSSVKHGKDRD